MKSKKTPPKQIRRRQQLALLSKVCPHYDLKANLFASLFLIGAAPFALFQ